MSVSTEQKPSPAYSSWRAQGLLFCGAALGIALAAMGVLRGPTTAQTLPQQPTDHTKSIGSLPPGVVARVNGRLISDEDFKQVLALEVSAGIVPDSATKNKILDRMINEELRVQHAIDLKLHYTDPRVRMDLSSAIADAAIAGIEHKALDKGTLLAYFNTRHEYFARRGPLHVRMVWVGIVGGNIGEAYNRARTAAKLLREKERFEIVTKVCGNIAPHQIPDVLLSPEELAKHIDGIVLNRALLMQKGEVSDPIRTYEGFHVLQLIDRQSQTKPMFENSLMDVEAEYWSESARNALEDNATWLRQNASIQKTDKF